MQGRRRGRHGPGQAESIPAVGGGQAGGSPAPVSRKIALGGGDTGTYYCASPTMSPKESGGSP